MTQVDRTAQEIRAGQLQWPFWTKLVVVAIGFTGGLVFMYIQCKVYVHLCRKWKAYNRVIVVQDAPEGVHRARAAQQAARRAKEAKAKEQAAAAAAAASAAGSDPPGGGGGSRDEEEGGGGGGGAEGGASASASATPATAAGKSNAETQTALRGVAIVEAMREHEQQLQQQQQQQQHRGSLGLLGKRGGHLRKGSAGAALDSGSSATGQAAPLFFTECEISAQTSLGGGGAGGSRSASSSFSCLRKSQSSAASSAMGQVREPVLICELPGASSSSLTAP